MSILARVKDYFTEPHSDKEPDTNQETKEVEDPTYQRLEHPMTAYNLNDIPPAQRRELEEQGLTTKEMIAQYNREVFEIFGNLDS